MGQVTINIPSLSLKAFTCLNMNIGKLISDMMDSSLGQQLAMNEHVTDGATEDKQMQVSGLPKGTSNVCFVPCK